MAFSSLGFILKTCIWFGLFDESVIATTYITVSLSITMMFYCLHELPAGLAKQHCWLGFIHALLVWSEWGCSSTFAAETFLHCLFAGCGCLTFRHALLQGPEQHIKTPESQLSDILVVGTKLLMMPTGISLPLYTSLCLLHAVCHRYLYRIYCTVFYADVS